MAIDTQAKRMAALGFSGSRPELPFPDGDVDNDDCYVLLGLYPFEASTGGSHAGFAYAFKNRTTEEPRILNSRFLRFRKT